MATYSEAPTIQGKWVKGSEIKSGTKCVLVTAAEPVESQFKTDDGKVKMRDVAKVRLEGEPEPMNITINRPSIAALVNAFGGDSAKWVNKPLTLVTEKVIVGGKRVTAVYLVPEGYEVTEDNGGFVSIVRADGGVDDSQIIDLDDPGEPPY